MLGFKSEAAGESALPLLEIEKVVPAWQSEKKSTEVVALSRSVLLPALLLARL